MNYICIYFHTLPSPTILLFFYVSISFELNRELLSATGFPSLVADMLTVWFGFELKRFNFAFVLFDLYVLISMKLIGYSLHWTAICAPLISRMF